MEYPGTHFPKTWRLALLIAFIVAFCIIAPLVILTTAGYRIDWNNHWLSFRGTGSLSIDIRPTNAQVYLNGIRLLGSIPYRLNSLTPDNAYTLRVTADGYFDWQKDVAIRANETYYLKDIAMLKKTDPINIVTGTIGLVSISPNGQTVLYVKNSVTKELWLLDTLSGNTTRLLNIPKPPKETTAPLTISWQAAGNYALVQITRDAPIFDWYVIATQQKKSQPLTVALNGTARLAMWNTSSEPEVYASVSATLFVYRPESGTTQTVGVLPAPLWHVDLGHVTTLALSTSTNSWALTKDIFGFPTLAATIPASELENSQIANTWKISGIVQNTTLLAHADSGTIKLITAKKSYTIPATHFLISPFNNWLLLWNDTEIWTYATGEEPKLLNRSGEKLKTIVPIDEYNTLALLWEKNTTVLYPYYLISHELLPAVTSLSANPTKRELYFSGEIKKIKGLWRLSY